MAQRFCLRSHLFQRGHIHRLCGKIRLEFRTCGGMDRYRKYAYRYPRRLVGPGKTHEVYDQYSPGPHHAGVFRKTLPLGTYQTSEFPSYFRFSASVFVFGISGTRVYLFQGHRTRYHLVYPHTRRSYCRLSVPGRIFRNFHYRLYSGYHYDNRNSGLRVHPAFGRRSQLGRRAVRSYSKRTRAHPVGSRTRRKILYGLGGFQRNYPRAFNLFRNLGIAAIGT